MKMSQNKKAERVRMTGITKRFGDVAANDGVDLTVYSGEILALLGENGSGKSTLMNMLSGIYAPDAGSIRIHDKPARFGSPQESIAAGIGMIHQHFKLVEVLSALDNIVGGQKGGFFLNRKAIRTQVVSLMEKYGLHIDPDRRVADMSVGEKQTLEILKVLYRGADILIMDEPTAVLTPQETRQLFAIMQRMKEQGCAIIIITHKMTEVLEVSDRVTVLRRGKTVGTRVTGETTAQELTDLLVGRAVNLSISRPEGTRADTVLQLTDVTCYGLGHRKLLDGVSFSLAGGEVLGIAGVANRSCARPSRA
jgi:simple sugar transport system ATP-binding protein